MVMVTAMVTIIMQEKMVVMVIAGEVENEIQGIPYGNDVARWLN